MSGAADEVSIRSWPFTILQGGKLVFDVPSDRAA